MEELKKDVFIKIWGKFRVTFGEHIMKFRVSNEYNLEKLEYYFEKFQLKVTY